MAGFTFKKATKKQAKARVGLAGPAGSGKTYTSLLLATSMCERVAVIDTEHGSASKYADIFEFDVLELDDFHPNNYIQAIQAAEKAGYDGLVIDSISHEWSGKNGCLELVDMYAKKTKGGNQWAAWADVTPLHNAFIEAIHSAKIHIFATMRSKMDYIQTDDGKGKKIIQKVGMAPITRDGVEYEFDIVGEMDLEHNLVITKSRCRALADKMFRMPGAELAEAIKAWLTDGAPEAAQHGQAAKFDVPGSTRSAQPANGAANGSSKTADETKRSDYYATVVAYLSDAHSLKPFECADLLSFLFDGNPDTCDINKLADFARLCYAAQKQGSKTAAERVAASVEAWRAAMQTPDEVPGTETTQGAEQLAMI